MSLSQRKQIPIRFTHDQAKDLEEAATFKGLSLQAALHPVVMDWLAEAKAQMSLRKDRRQARMESDARSVASVGLGIRSHLSRAPEPTPIEIPTPSPVVVNVGAGVGTKDDFLSRLVRRVHEAPSHEHESRTRKALAAIDCYADDDAERRSLTEQFEAEIKKTARKSSLFDDSTRWLKGILG